MTPKPIYLYQCLNNHVDYAWKDKGDYPNCPECALRMKRVNQPKTLDMDREGYWLKKANKDKREIRRLMDFEVAMRNLLKNYAPQAVPTSCIPVLEALVRLAESRKKDS